MMLTPEQYKIATKELHGIVDIQTKIATSADFGDSSTLTGIKEVGRQLDENILRVLVMGRFSSGKSTFLNALMGQNLLPSKAIPTTAVIGEIVYKEQPEAILFPKKGYPGGETPFNIQINELKDYIVIDHSNIDSDQPRKTNPFKKVTIKYPLDICKHGIMFVDSPGLDDPTCHDTITQEYLPKADAIVFCMSCTQAFTAADKKEIERLVALGYKSIIFVLTYYDSILNNDEMTGNHEADEVRRHYTQLLSSYTDLGESGVFFVSSLYALNGKLRSNPAMLQKSNFLPLEKRLGEILFNEKGRMKLMRALYAIRKVNRNTGQHLTDKIEIANADKNGLSQRISVAQNNLNQAHAKANEIEAQFRFGVQNIINGSKDRGRAFFLSEILSNILKWANEFQPSKGQEISMWHPKSTVTSFSEACIKYIQGCIETELARWCELELVARYIMPQFDALTSQQNSNLKSFESDLKSVRSNLQLSLNGESTVNGEQSGTERILSAISSAFSNGANGPLFERVLGWDSLIPGLVSQIVTAMVIGIVSFFNPVSFPIAVIITAVAGIVGTSFGMDTIEAKIRKRLADEMRQNLAQQQEVIARNIEDSLSSVFAKMQIAISKGLNSPVKQYENILNEAQDTLKVENSALQKRVSNYTELRKRNTELANNLDSFAEKIGI